MNKITKTAECSAEFMRCLEYCKSLFTSHNMSPLLQMWLLLWKEQPSSPDQNIKIMSFRLNLPTCKKLFFFKFSYLLINRMTFGHFKINLWIHWKKREFQTTYFISCWSGGLVFPIVGFKGCTPPGVGGAWREHSSPGITHLLPPTIEHAVPTSHG